MKRKPFSCPLRLERLENRHLLASNVFGVFEVVDDGSGTVEDTLSWAIFQANSKPAADSNTIVFSSSIPGQLVTVTGSLPIITAPRVEVTGPNAAEQFNLIGVGSANIGLTYDGNDGVAGEFTVQNLEVSGFGASGIVAFGLESEDSVTIRLTNVSLITMWPE